MVELSLTPREARAMANAVGLGREVLEGCGVPKRLREFGIRPGESRIEIAHCKLLHSIEVAEMEREMTA